MSMKVAYCFIVLVIVFSCLQKAKNPPPVEKLKISIQEKIKKSLTNEYLEKLGITPFEGKLVRKFYARNGYNPKWCNDSTLTPKGIELKELVSHPLQFGIPETRYSHLKWQKNRFVQDEILISVTLALLAKDLKEGFVNEDSMTLKPLIPIPLAELEKIARFDNDTLSIAQQIIRLGPLDTNYQQLAKGLFDFCSNFPIDTNQYKIKPNRSDSIYRDLEIRKVLISKGYLNQEQTDSLTFTSALKLFQLQNGLDADGRIGIFTADALNESTKHKLLRTALTMEKWRWKTEYPSDFVRINIPEYILRFYENDSLASINKIIIGKPETSTPTLTSSIRMLVIFPYWTVPQSIADKEILLKARLDDDYFEKNHFKIFRNEEEVNPKTVHWNRLKGDHFPYKVRQEFGFENSLGILKFEFHNRFGVYIHDTPNKTLFQRTIRAFSHGCMRCENPIELAKKILNADSIHSKRTIFTASSLDSLIALEQNFYLKLKNPIPLFVEYKTVTVEKDLLVFHLDIYTRDEKYIRLMLN